MTLHDVNRKRLLQRLKDKKVSEKAVVLLEGGKSSDFQRYSSDVCHVPFRQVSEVLLIRNDHLINSTETELPE